MQEEQAGRLREAIASLDRKNPKEAFPGWLRELAVEYARAGRERGLAWKQLARMCGLSSESLRRWSEAVAGKNGAAALVPVHVEEAVVSAGSPRRGGLVLVSPRGFRLEGLDVGGAYRLLEALS